MRRIFAENVAEGRRNLNDERFNKLCTKIAFYSKSNMIECLGHVASFGKGFKYCQNSEI